MSKKNDNTKLTYHPVENNQTPEGKFIQKVIEGVVELQKNIMKQMVKRK